MKTVIDLVERSEGENILEEGPGCVEIGDDK